MSKTTIDWANMLRLLEEMPSNPMSQKEYYAVEVVIPALLREKAGAPKAAPDTMLEL